jgi:CheY-like chemotaxis protein
MFSILYVDDEPGLLDIGKIFLEKNGLLSVDTILSAQEAMDTLHQTPYDCIVSDYQMPEIDGIEFLKIVRSIWGNIPFILFTGKGREEVVIEALNSGADFYLQKGGEPRSQFTELEHKILLAIERQTTREKLRNSERRLFDIINFLPDPTFAIDLNGKVIAWNHAIEELSGVSKDTVLGTGDYGYSLHIFGERGPIFVDMVLQDVPELHSQYQYINREGDRLIAERYVPTLNNGQGAHLWITSSPLYDSEGNINGVIGSLRDISSRKRSEEEMRETFEQLAATEEELRQQY